MRVTSDKTRMLEIFAILITVIGKFIFLNGLEWRLGFIVTVFVSWAIYIAYRYKQQPAILQSWGLTTKNFRSTFVELLPIVVVCVLVFMWVGYEWRTSVLDWSIVGILILYPIWGILQQFLVLGVFGKNLLDIRSWKLSKYAVILITAILFGLIHYPFPLLMLGTFLLALVYVTLFFRGRNLLVLGIYHGWLAAFFFYTVLGRNAWQEVFGGLGW